MKHIVLFSGGCGSAYEAYLAVEKYGKDKVTLLHTPTFAEHPSTNDFMEKIANHLGLEIEYKADGRTLWELIDQYKAMPNHRLPFCTQQLKQRQTEKIVNKLNKEGVSFTLHFGYGREETRRVQRQVARFETKGINVEYLLFKSQISSEDVKKAIINDWKICLPIAYKVLGHNNCLPCFKGGKKHFYLIWKHFPSYFQKARETEEKTNYTVFKDCTLKQLEERFLNNKQMDMLEGNLENVECMCSL